VKRTTTKVFLGCRSTDPAVVAEFAGRLRWDEIDAWYDGGRLRLVEDNVAKIDEGIDRCGPTHQA
jgi:hypothetical protein